MQPPRKISINIETNDVKFYDNYREYTHFFYCCHYESRFLGEFGSISDDGTFLIAVERDSLNNFCLNALVSSFLYYREKVEYIECKTTDGRPIYYYNVFRSRRNIKNIDLFEKSVDHARKIAKDDPDAKILLINYDHGLVNKNKNKIVTVLQDLPSNVTMLRNYLRGKRCVENVLVNGYPDNIEVETFDLKTVLGKIKNEIQQNGRIAASQVRGWDRDSIRRRRLLESQMQELPDRKARKLLGHTKKMDGC